MELPSQEGWHQNLAGVLQASRSAFRWGVLDTPLDSVLLNHLALAASDDVIAVCPPDFMAVRSLPMLLETVEEARTIRPGLRCSGWCRRTYGREHCMSARRRPTSPITTGDLLLPGHSTPDRCG